MSVVYLGLGSNMGDRVRHLRRTIYWLNAIEGGAVDAVSAVYETPPSGGPSGQGLFLNAAVRMVASLSPSGLLHQLQAIERKLGRLPETQRPKWAPRPMDLDMLLYDDRVIREPHLVVPHPLMTDRWFVLQPMCDIAADVVHPENRRTMAELLKSLNGSGYDRGRAVDVDLTTCLNPRN